MDDYFKSKMTTEKFLRNVYKHPSGCWEWEGALNSGGYGNCAVRYPDGKVISRLTHRVAWVIFKDIIPENMCVCHRCDNPKCVNPAHLFLGTHKDNMRDRNNKGRASGPRRLGESNNHAKLTEQFVKEIRQKYRGGVSMSKLSKEYKTCFQNISSIVNRKTWRHVDG